MAGNKIGDLKVGIGVESTVDQDLQKAENSLKKFAQEAGKTGQATQQGMSTANEAIESVGVTSEKTEKKPRAPRRRKVVEEKPVDLTASGLQLVETKGEAVKAEAAPATAATRKPRKPAAWQQKGAEQPQEEPLVIVQTQK